MRNFRTISIVSLHLYNSFLLQQLNRKITSAFLSKLWLHQHLLHLRSVFEMNIEYLNLKLIYNSLYIIKMSNRTIHIDTCILIFVSKLAKKLLVQINITNQFIKEPLKSSIYYWRSFFFCAKKQNKRHWDRKNKNA